MTDRNRDNDSQIPQPPARSRDRVLTRVGRANSAQNATRHGALSRQIVGSSEEEAAFNELLTELEREYDPASATEYSLVQRLATLFWRERRLARSEAMTLRETEVEVNPYHGQSPFSVDYQLLVGRYQTMLGNQIKKTIDQIREIKSFNSQ